MVKKNCDNEIIFLSSVATLIIESKTKKWMFDQAKQEL